MLHPLTTFHAPLSFAKVYGIDLRRKDNIVAVVWLKKLLGMVWGALSGLGGIEQRDSQGVALGWGWNAPLGLGRHRIATG